MFICPRCSVEFNSYNSLAKHTNAKYKLSGESLYREYHGITEIVTCKCGCGTPTKWRIDRGYGEYANGHNSKGKNNVMFGKTHSKEARTNISSKRKARFADGTLKVWCDGLTKETDERLRTMGENISNNTERSAKISSALSGVPKSDVHKQNSRIGIKKAWENEELREKQSHNRMLLIQKNGWQITSTLEIAFEKILQVLNISYHKQHYVREIKSLYDFYLSEHSIIVEVHGDFWHCNPNIPKYSVPKYDAQHNNIINDKKKKQWCIDNNIPLLIFWESDILNNPQNIITELLAEINKTSP